jgi:hypothetical protein
MTYPATKEFRKKIIEVTPCRFIREIPVEFIDSDFVKQHDQRKDEFVTDFFETMRKQFAEKGLDAASENIEKK